jgi:hypothetical protein
MGVLLEALDRELAGAVQRLGVAVEVGHHGGLERLRGPAHDRGVVAVVLLQGVVPAAEGCWPSMISLTARSAADLTLGFIVMP